MLTVVKHADDSSTGAYGDYETASEGGDYDDFVLASEGDDMA